MCSGLTCDLWIMSVRRATRVLHPASPGNHLSVHVRDADDGRIGAVFGRYAVGKKPNASLGIGHTTLTPGGRADKVLMELTRQQKDELSEFYWDTDVSTNTDSV